MMDRMDFTKLLYDQVHDRESLIESLQSLLGAETSVLTVVPYGSYLAPAECFKSSSSRNIELVRTCEGVSLFRLTFSAKKRTERKEDEVEGRFFVYEQADLPKVFFAATIEPVDFVRRALIPFMEQSRPQIYLTFVKHETMRMLLQGFRQNQGYSDLRVVRVSLISRFDAEKGETMIPSVSWPRLGLDGAFAYAEEHNGWFRSLTFEALKNSKVVAEASVGRNGIVKTDGDFRGVYRSLVRPISELIAENIRLFANRGRREDPQLGVRPLAIEFPRDQFSDVTENARFISSVRKLDNASVSVLHGNPYIALSVVDYTDGSTFDLWVLNPRELVIVPQLKSSVLGIKRLISCVFDNYAEGSIREFSTEAVV